MAAAPKRSLLTSLFSSRYRPVNLISLLFVLVALPLMVFVLQPRNHAASELTQSQLLAQQKWPNLFGKTGVYWIANTTSTEDEINKIAANGDTLFVTYYRGITDSTFNSIMSANPQMTYIDRFLWDVILNDCAAVYGSGNTCSPDTNTTLQNKILGDTKAHLDDPVVQTDTRIAGYWILDDYQGPMVGTLEKIAAQVHAATTPFPRPTLCGFSGGLDYAYTIGGTWNYNNQSFTTAIQNFSPNACDFAVYYPYGSNSGSSDPNLINWDVTDLLSRAAANDGLIALTQQQGVRRVPSWDPSTLLWGAVPQAFGNNPWPGTNGFVTPTATDMVTMDKAYCTTGAAFLLDYTYDDGQGERYNEPFNDSVLAQGQVNGHVQCRNYFLTASSSPTPTPALGDEQTLTFTQRTIGLYAYS